MTTDWNKVGRDRSGKLIEEFSGNELTFDSLLGRYNALTGMRSSAPALPDAAVTGWRLLEVGEEIQAGDELLMASQTWSVVKANIIGESITEKDASGSFVVRRRLPAAPRRSGEGVEAARREAWNSACEKCAGECVDYNDSESCRKLKQ